MHASATLGRGPHSYKDVAQALASACTLFGLGWSCLRRLPPGHFVAHRDGHAAGVFVHEGIARLMGWADGDEEAEFFIIGVKFSGEFDLGLNPGSALPMVDYDIDYLNWTAGAREGRKAKNDRLPASAFASTKKKIKAEV